MEQRPVWAPATVDLNTPSAARLYDYYLGGNYNFAVDRQLANRIYQALPEMPYLARVNRSFLGRAVRFCVSQGVRQFLDIGCGLPTLGSVHEIAQRVDPRCRVAYVDNEPVAVAHGELLLAGNPNAGIALADVRDVHGVLNSKTVTRLLDFNEPVAVLMVALLHFIPDADRPVEMIARYREAMAPGSYLVLSHVSDDELPGVSHAAEFYKNSQNPVTLRGRAQVERLMGGFELVDPGLVFCPDWRPDTPEDTDEAAAHPPCSFYAGVGRRTEAP
ncbi:SAM-dependent methyltransferase [Goodfellowiella coeruleoviolacea]|uniref:S-adenosyl methyltransferase n=1 Tax=Goodfellowiella coeruleoviolacea TaxID=334858 RepID=A0AAE3GDR1_9PSEU|nr:SAM-dependent methyltransferase [Goodfellowiella coeruleoviolacea]MCP2166421.1 S-adenosyl methyltransferase [Goodfellowiella coeruleoviolacea]